MRSFYKVMVLISAVVFIYAVLIVSGISTASGNLLISVTETAGEMGEEVAVEIVVDNAANTEGGQFVLNFDPEIVRPVSIETEAFITDSASSLDMANLEYASGQLMFIWVTAAADTANYGTLCTIIFEILKEGESLLEIDEVIISPEGLNVNVEPGLITAEGNDSELDPDQKENNAAEPVQNADGEGLRSDVRTVNPVAIVVIVLAVLAAGGFFIYKYFKKPGV